jgi:protein OPY2
LPALVVRPPDAIEKSGAPDTGGLDPNPFADIASTRSGSGQSIPIALDGNSLPPHGTSPTGTTFTAPARPHRSPDLTLRDESDYFDRPTSTLEPPRPGYAPSQRSGFTVSTMDSTASSAMEALYESPTIVSASSRQVLGAVRAEVVQVGGLSPNGIHQPAHLQPRRSQTGPSPLSTSHIVGRFPTIEEDPFSDRSKRPRDSSATDQTFGSASATSPLPRGVARASAQDFDHTLPLTSATETQNDHGSSVAGSVSRRTSQDSVVSAASRTDSVLASFPFVPPSPLPNTHTRSPLSVVFNHDRRSTSSVHLAEAPCRTHIPPPLPVHHNVAEMNRATSDAVPRSPTFAPESDPLQPARQRVESTMSRASASSAGLGAFHFQFAPDGEAPLPLPNPAFYNDNTPRNSLNAPSTSVGRTSDDLTTSSSLHDSNSSNSQLPYLPNQKQTHASLDTLELSRDLTANRLSYD